MGYSSHPPSSALKESTREGVNVLLKVIIFVLLIGVIVSLFSGLFFLFKDAEKRDSRRTLHALGVRVTLAAALLDFDFLAV